MIVVAEQFDFVVGIDTHAKTHTLAIVSPSHPSRAIGGWSNQRGPHTYNLVTPREGPLGSGVCCTGRYLPHSCIL